MSEHNQDTAANARPRRRIRRRLSKSRLPTPPPNPLSLSEPPKTPTERNINFFDSISSIEKCANALQNSSSDPFLGPVLVSDEAFEHLQTLSKIMDQMISLSEQHSRLHKRLCDLQYLKKLQTIQRQFLNPSALNDLPSSKLDDDNIFAETLLKAMLSGNKQYFKHKLWAKTRFRQSLIKKQRNRSSSLTENHTSLDSDNIQNRRKSSALIDRIKTAKVSKWTKVKAAFKWEKASPSVSGAKSQDSGLGVMVPMNNEVARYLRVPSDEHSGISPGDSGAAEGSSPGSLSSASSTDDVHHTEYDKLLGNDKYYNKECTKNKPSRKRNKQINPDSRSLDNFSNDELKTDVSDCEDHSYSTKSGYLEDSLKSDTSKVEIPNDVVERYRQVTDETICKQKSAPKRVSKWIKVKKAFLSPSLVHTKNSSSANRSFGICKEFHFGKAEDDSHVVQSEIEKNYQELRDRIYQEFDKKYPELRDSISSNLTDSVSGSTEAEVVKEEEKSQAHDGPRANKLQQSKPRESIQMLKENLAPEFKKKLDEWEKFKKHSAKDDLTLVTKTKKKLGEWPKWKSVSTQKHEPIIEQPQPSTSKTKNKLKDYEMRGLQWFEKELIKIEKEKQILELQRQKFIQREERIAKLQKTALGNNGNKKDILIHTPSGFYKFEGISREFTQKLCEWEKARGIKPEESTFALLSSSFTPNITVDSYDSDFRQKEHSNSLRLLRSKSAESVAPISNLVEPCSSAAHHHPSSLSLNDVEELERQCFSLSENSSAQDIYSSLDKFQHDEPEAVIVEFEDEVEETAAPLELLEEKHFPVYQREKPLSMCDNNFQVAPCVQVENSSSNNNNNNSRYSFYIIEESLALLKSITDDENAECGSMALNFSNFPQHGSEPQSPDLIRFQNIIEMQIHRANQIIDNLIRLQDLHSKSISEITEEKFISSGVHFHSLLETSQDIFSDLFQMTEHLQTILQNKKFSPSFQFTDCAYSDVIATTSEMTSKFSEYKRILTYLFAASDLTASQRHQPNLENIIRSNESQNAATCSESEDSFEINEESVNTKRTRYKKRSYQNETVYEVEDYIDIEKPSEQSREKMNCYETLNAIPAVLENLIIPTKPTTFTESSAFEHETVDVLVKTTKKRFAPIIVTETRRAEHDGNEVGYSSMRTESHEDDSSNVQEPNVRRPPLLSSPISQRKLSNKEISPSIRLMLAKYNQLISEQEGGNGSIKSAGSSGSASPVAWRSPVSERRVKAQRERYLEVVRKNFNVSEVKKSASACTLNLENKSTPLSFATDVTNEMQNKKLRGILRSTSATAIETSACTKGVENKAPQLKLFIPKQYVEDSVPSPSLRNVQIQKAKEKFLNSSSTLETSPVETTSAPALIERKKQKAINRFSQVSVGSESSCDSSAYPGALIKSASAGMINVDENTYKNIDPAFHQDGYVTLPRLAQQKEKEGFLGGKLSLSNIASKFRKVRMRKSKEHKKMTTVSTLCRQSLTVDIKADNHESSSPKRETRSDSLTVPENQTASSSEDTSPSSSRSGSWIRRSRIFKAL